MAGPEDSNERVTAAQYYENLSRAVAEYDTPEARKLRDEIGEIHDGAVSPRKFVPLSVREGGRRKKLAWWFSGRRQWLALKIAPWFAGTAAEAAGARLVYRGAADPPYYPPSVRRLLADQQSSTQYPNLARKMAEPGWEPTLPDPTKRELRTDDEGGA